MDAEKKQNKGSAVVLTPLPLPADTKQTLPECQTLDPWRETAAQINMSLHCQTI